MDVGISSWVIFNLLVLTLLGIDLWHSYANPHAIRLKEAILTSIGWILLALMFNGWIYLYYGAESGTQFLASYLLEKSLSVDNLFIFLLIFSHFKVPDQSKHTVLFYGILGAVIMRALLIFGGITLVAKFSWLLQVFGVFLIFAGTKLLMAKEEKIDFEANFLYRFIQRWIKVTRDYHDQKFFIKQDSIAYATPLFLVLLLIESIDLLFALDSIPAVLGITTDPFIVYTSNILAILGLRSLFFVLEDLSRLFYLLHYAVALILIFIGAKMLVNHFIEVPTILTLSVILGLICIALLGSYFFPRDTTRDL